MRALLVAVDVGGTFTDVMALGRDGAVVVVKVPSRPEDPAGAFVEAAERLAGSGVRLGDAGLVFYGTTIATNAILTGGLGRVVLACTAGFRDMLTYRDGRRDRIYDLTEPPHSEWVAENDRVEVRERLSGEGRELEPLTEDEVRRAVDEVARRRPEAVAVAFLFSYLDDRHEVRLAEAIAERLPGVPVATSASVAREFREYPRTATAVLNASLRPIVARALGDVVSTLETLGATAPLLVMQSNGGCVPAARAPAEAHRLVLSGPAGGVAATVALGSRYGIGQLISVDMGGTSLDVCLVSDGTAPVKPTRTIDGFKVLCPSVDAVAVGSGGGSIARVDRSGRLRVGPESAGALPGPAAYGRGGTRPTVTDAHVVAGSLPADLPLGGSLRLDPRAAHEALSGTAGEIGMSVPEVAAGIVAVTVAQMVGAVRRVSVEQGLDPRLYTLVVFGGAGPLHAGMLLREVGARAALIPRYPGLFAASGLLASDLRVDESQTLLRPLDDETVAEMRSWFGVTGAALRARLRSDGIAARDVRLLASADCRFVGQGYELNVSIGEVTSRSLTSLTSLTTVRETFCELHQASYGHADRAQQVEVVSLRLSAFGRLDAPELPTLAQGRRAPPAAAAIGETRLSLPHGTRGRRATVFDRSALRARNEIRGPAVVHQLDSTILVLAGQRARVDALGSIWLEESPG